MDKSNYNLDICFLGGLYPDEIYNQVVENSISGLQNAANLFQWSLVNGLDSNLKTPVTIINKMFIGSFPKNYKEIMVKRLSFEHTLGAKDVNIGFLNLAFIKNFSLGIKLTKEIRKWILNSNSEKKAILVYSTNKEFMRAALKIRNEFEEVKLIIIVPDLPEYMMMGKDNNLIRKLYKNYNSKVIYNLLPKFDAYILLTEYMNTYLSNNKPYLVVEGAYNLKYNRTSNEKFGYINKDIKTVLYTGSLTKKYGIMDLITAFRSINRQDIQLIICGDGEAKDEIEDISLGDDRIIYKGVLEQSEVLKLQKQVTLLVNPRKNNEEYTKYSFPSKLIEYLASGRPVLAHKLPGVPDDYDKHILYFSKEDTISVSETIEKYLFSNEVFLYNFGEKAKKFILKNKNNKIQSKKILSFILEQFGEIS